MTQPFLDYQIMVAFIIIAFKAKNSCRYYLHISIEDMKIRAFILPHKAEKMSDCEDRFAINPDKKFIAVSDGITQSIFQAEWAELIVNHFVDNGSLTDNDRVEILCPKWRQIVIEHINKTGDWMLESMLAEGKSAGATLCGVSFEDSGRWTCRVLGDSCLITLNDQKVENIFTSEEKDFDNYPDYLDSNPNRKGRGDFKIFEGEVSEGQSILLVTDAFSDFFSQHIDNSEPYIKQLLNVSNHEDYKTLVENWRNEGLHDDDCTVVIVEWDGSSDFNYLHVDDYNELVKDDVSPSTDVLDYDIDVKDELKGNTTGSSDITPPTPTANTNGSDLNTVVAANDYPTVASPVPPLTSDKDSSVSVKDGAKNNTTIVPPAISPKQSPSAKKGTNRDVSTIKTDGKDVSVEYQRMASIIPVFLNNFIQNDIEISKCKGFNSIIHFIFKKNTHKDKELFRLLEYTLNHYIDYLKKTE